MMEGPNSVEKHEPASDVATVVVDSLKALDPNRPIREADSCTAAKMVYSTRVNFKDSKAVGLGKPTALLSSPIPLPTPVWKRQGCRTAVGG